jgi:hypothetical protein
MMTITTRSRYLSMLYAALANAEQHRQLLPGASGLAQRRKAVEPFERLWALACVAAREAGTDGTADGLRGISYAEKSYRHFANNGKKVNCDFPLLKYQSRTGAVGTYWTALLRPRFTDPKVYAYSSSVRTAVHYAAERILPRSMAPIAQRCCPSRAEAPNTSGRSERGFTGQQDIA